MRSRGCREATGPRDAAKSPPPREIRSHACEREHDDGKSQAQHQPIETKSREGIDGVHRPDRRKWRQRDGDDDREHRAREHRTEYTQKYRTGHHRGRGTERSQHHQFLTITLQHASYKTAGNNQGRQRGDEAENTQGNRLGLD